MSDELQNPNEGKCVPVTSSPMHDKEFPWVPENNAKSKQRTKRQPSKKAKLTATANPAEPHRPPIEQNRSSYQNWETRNAAQQTQNPSFSVSGGTRSTDHMAKKKLVFIAGDSIIQHVQGWDLSTNDKHVAVKSFSGARIADMDDYLRPLLGKKPDEIILHVGTSNIRNESPCSVAEGIVNLVTQIQHDSPTTHLAISPLLPRSDNLDFNDKIREANKIFKLFCSSRGLTLLGINNIDLTCLNRRGVHLNRKGSSLLLNCYADYLNSN